MTQVAAAPSALAPGTQIGAYRIVRKIGQGGMAVVYEAINDEICKRVALKVLLPSYTAQDETEQRFLNEARAVNQVSHPGLVNIFDFGKSADGHAYIAMEFIDGITLATFLRRRTRFQLYQGLCVLQQLAVTLTAVHSHQIVHRDLKPTNIFVMRDEAVLGGIRMKLFDFGIAKIGGQAAESGGAQADGRMLTQTGVFLGTPYYIAPEQIQDPGQVTDRADVYAFGVILYQMLSGHVPFEGDAMWVLLRQATERPVPLELVIPDLPAELGALSEAMLAKNPSLRPSMERIAEALGTLLVSLGDSMLRRERSLSALSAQSLWQTETVTRLAGPVSSATDDRQASASLAGLRAAESAARGAKGTGDPPPKAAMWTVAAAVGVVAAVAAAAGAYWALSPHVRPTASGGAASTSAAPEVRPNEQARAAGDARSSAAMMAPDLAGPTLGSQQHGLSDGGAPPDQLFESVTLRLPGMGHGAAVADAGTGATDAPSGPPAGNITGGQPPAATASKPRTVVSTSSRGGGEARRPGRVSTRPTPHRKPPTPAQEEGTADKPNGSPKGDDAKPDFTNDHVENLK